MKRVVEALVKLANHLDNKGYHAEADMADGIVQKITAMEEVPDEAEQMQPMKDEEVEEEAPEKKAEEVDENNCVMKDAEANLRLVQMRRRARQRRLMLK